MNRSMSCLRSVGVLGLSALLWAAVPPESPVADAAMRADLGKVRLLLKGGADVNVAQGDGMTALHWSAENRSAEMAAMLIYAGANVEAVTRIGGYTPLHLASRAGSTTIVQGLLEAGADPAVRSSVGGATPLHLAASASSMGSVLSLLDHGAEIDAREHAWGQTPLIFASSLGRTEVVELLLDRGADVSITTSPIYLPALQDADRAARQRRDKVLDGFRAVQDVSGAESWRPSPTEVQAALESSRIEPNESVDPEEEDEDTYNEQVGVPGGNSYADLVGTMGGTTALIHAVREGHVETAKVLLDGGADVNQPSSGDRTTALLSATINGHFDLALELLKLGADPGLASTGGTTPLFAVVNTKWAPKARYPQQEAHKQQQATHLEVMKALLESGADPNARLTKHLWFMEYTFSHLGIDASGATPFWRATHALDVPAMELLVEYGADPSIPTTKGQDRRSSRGGGGEDPSGLPPAPFGGPAVYPIHVAAGHGYGTGYAGYSHRHAPDAWLATVKYLVEKHGADVNVRDHNGYSPLHNAASRGDTDMIRYLVDKGADVMVVSRRGQTTIDMANGPQQRIQPFPEAIVLLGSLGAKNNHNCVSC